MTSEPRELWNQRMRFEAPRVRNDHPSATQALRKTHSGAGLRSPPWVSLHRRKFKHKAHTPGGHALTEPARSSTPPPRPATPPPKPRTAKPPKPPSPPTTPVQYGAHVDFDLPDEDHERPASPSDPRRRPIAAEEDVAPPNRPVADGDIGDY